MIIPNIWKNKSHVPNHQPEILDKHCIALFHGTCGYSLTALDPAKPFFNAPLDAGSRRRPNSAVAYILTRGNPRGWWKTTGILYDLTIQNRDFTTESWIIWIWVCWNMGYSPKISWLSFICFYESMKPFLGQPGVVRLLRTYQYSPFVPSAATWHKMNVTQSDWPPASLDVALEPDDEK